MENLVIRRGETLEVTIKADDDTATSVQLKAVKDGIVYFNEIENFVEGVAVISTNDTNKPIGEYPFTLKITYSDGFIEILPDPEECEGECELPVIKICESTEDEAIVS